jgi:iron complex outermembrane receptor protein
MAKSYKGVGSLMAAVMMLAAPPLLAVEVLEDIVVTSQRVESDLQETPIAVSAFDENEIARRQSFNVVDIVNNVPNLVGNNNIGQGTATTVFLRGVGTTESIVTVDTAMGFYVDDVYIARQGVNNFSLFDVERVEVLRGPQGTLYGRNTSAGALNVVTRQPQDFAEAGFEASAGEYDRYNLKGYVNAPVIEDMLFIRANVAYEQGDGYSDNKFNGDEVNDRDFWGLRGGLRWVPADNLEFLITGDISRSDEKGLYAFDISGITRPPRSDLFEVFSGTNTSNKGETEGGALTITWDISDALSIQSISSARNTYQKWNLDLTDQPVPIFLLYTINDSDQISQEFKFTGNLMNDRLHYVTGVFLFNEDSTSFIGDYFQSGGAFFSRDYDVETDSWAVYANFTYDFTDKLSVILGGRYTYDDKNIDIDARAFGQPGFVNNGAPNYLFSESEDFDEFTPRVAIEYSFTEDLLGYLSYQEGFKSGGWSARTNAEEEVLQFDPETVNSYAAGVKWTTLEGRARINTEAFFYDYEDLFNTGTGSGGNFVVATSDAEIYGVEVETTWRLSDSFDAYGFLAWQDGDYENLDPGAEFVGGELQRLPEWNYKIGGTYRRPLNVIPGELILNGNYSWTKDHYTNLQNTELARSGDISRLDLTAGWESDDGRYYAGISCRNCTDDTYINQSLDFAGFGFITVYPGEPRTWLLTVRARTGE